MRDLVFIIAQYDMFDGSLKMFKKFAKNKETAIREHFMKSIYSEENPCPSEEKEFIMNAAIDELIEYAADCDQSINIMQI